MEIIFVIFLSDKENITKMIYYMVIHFITLYVLMMILLCLTLHDIYSFFMLFLIVYDLISLELIHDNIFLFYASNSIQIHIIIHEMLLMFLIILHN